MSTKRDHVAETGETFPRQLMAGGSARAQAPTRTIAGIVADPAGTPVAGARFRLTNRDSGLSRLGYAHALSNLGRHGEALDEVDRALVAEQVE
jgi:hypothetical protein